MQHVATECNTLEAGWEHWSQTGSRTDAACSAACCMRPPAPLLPSGPLTHLLALHLPLLSVAAAGVAIRALGAAAFHPAAAAAAAAASARCEQGAEGQPAGCAARLIPAWQKACCRQAGPMQPLCSQPATHLDRQRPAI